MGKTTLKHNTIFNDLLLKPEKAIETLDLIYVDYAHFPIERIRHNKDFRYLYKGKKLDDKAHLERIQNLVVPPAWEEVRITDLPNGHLQAVGRDKRKRRQYRYHPLWLEVRNQTKFYKMVQFGEKLPGIRRKVSEHLELDGWPKKKVLALVISLMEETHIRIGNEQYAKRNQTYGLSTLRSKHLKSHKDKLRFEFTGKRGKEHRVTLRNKQLIRLVNRCEEIPGWELFKFFDEDNNKNTIDSGMVNSYIQDLAGDQYSAKDFRTWGASLLCYEFLREQDERAADPDRSKTLLNAYDHTAKALGNTRKVCREYYVHPAIPKAWTEQNLLDQKSLKIDHNDKYFTDSEAAMLQLIRNFKPELPVS